MENQIKDKNSIWLKDYKIVDIFHSHITLFFRHPDKRSISQGICIKERKYCDMHDDCLGSGGKCCNGFCCNEKYFNEIKNLECFSDDGCKVKNTSAYSKY